MNLPGNLQKNNQEAGMKSGITVVCRMAQAMMTSLLALAILSSSAQAQMSDAPAASAVSAQAPADIKHIRKTFDHLKTSFELKGAHLSVACESCHVGGTFKGTPKDCAGCHTTGRQAAATAKPQTHIPTTKACDNCHTTAASFATAVMDHTALTQPCSVCHNGANAGIKSMSSSHILVPPDAKCDDCHKNTFSFLAAQFKHVDASGAPITANCTSANCHGTPSGSGALGEPSNHPYNHYTTPPELRCEVCHMPAAANSNFTSFLGAIFNHALTGGTACATCHNGSLNGVLGKPSTHIPTTAPCETCHSPSVTTPGGFKAPNWTMNHAGITSNCVTCHGGQSFQGSVPNPPVNKPATHIPTQAACETCHANTSTGIGGFAAPNWAMSHTGITTNCATCHGGQTFAGTPPVIPVNKASVTVGTHIATTLSCETCHTSTATPGGFATWTMNHTGITTGCSTCHLASGDAKVGTATVKGVPAGHIAILTGCESCHTSTATGGFASWTMNHAANGNTSNCASCHGSGSSFYNAPTLVTLSTTAHVPVGSIACESCHTSTATTTGEFSTAWTMGTTGHALVTATACSVCHDTGAAFTGVKTKSTAHITYSSGALCSDCHTATNTNGYTTFLNATFDHSQITPGATCASCHGGLIAGIMTEPSGHTATTLDCKICHQPNIGTSGPGPIGGFKTWTMNHTANGNTSNCASCHTGAKVINTVVMGRNSNHITTSAACENCHANTNPGGFAVPNPAMNHAGITVGCATCHTGANAGATVTTIVVGKPVGHIATSIACELCHTTAPTGTGPLGGFSNWVMDHTSNGNTSNCASCHTGASVTMPSGAVVTVKGMPSGHVTTSTGCESCHTSTSPGGFATWTMNHAANGNTSNCASCHTGASVTMPSGAVVTVKGKPATHIATGAATACESCHSAASTNVGGFAAPNWTMNHAALPSLPPSETIRCDSCHGLANAFQGVTITNQNTFQTHPVNIGSQDCGTCHGSVTSFITSTTYSHANVTPGSCNGCHGTPPTIPNAPTAMQQPAGHLVTSLSCDNSGCHTSAAALSGTVGGFQITSFAHTTPSQAVLGSHQCGSICHNGSTVNGHFNGAVMPGTNGTTGTHINLALTTIPAASCDSCHNSTTSFLNAVMNHTGITANCASCHGGQFAGVVAKPSYHIATKSGLGCESCHPATSTSVGGFSAPYWMMGSSQHTANGNTTGCAACHTGATVGTAVIKGKASNHIPTSIACESCHSNTSAGGFAVPNPAMNHAGITNNCASCHTGLDAGSTVSTIVLGKAANHIPTATACETCHAQPTGVGPIGGFAVPNPAMNHAGITVGCASCHNGANAGVTVTTTVMGMPAKHIPTSLSCEACHTTAPTGVGPIGGFTSWTMGTNQHIANGNTTGCATCHASGASFQITSGTPLVTLSTTNHVPVGSLACESCHSTSNFSTGAFSTTWTMGGTGHALVNTTPCASCHTAGATVSQYTGVTAQNGPEQSGPATGSSFAHTTTAACDTCHTASNTSSYTTFQGATGAHTSNPLTAANPTCISCHGNNMSTGSVGPGGGKSTITNHIPIGSSDCGACHAYTSFTTWTAATVHTVATGTACSTCHKASGDTTAGTVVIKGKPATGHIATSIACETCHTSTTSPGGFSTWTMGTSQHTANSNTTGCATCHGSGVSFVNNGGTPLVTLSTSIHVPTGTVACETCHSTSNFAAGAFATAWTMGTTGHTAALAVTPLCGTCHGASSTYTGVVIFDSNHISSSYYPAQDCGTNCHTASSTSNYSVGGFLLLNMKGNAQAHTGITTCASCHNGTIAVGTASISGFTHMAITTDCSGCHNATNTSGFQNFLGATAGHDLSTTGVANATNNCASNGCHATGTTTAAGKLFTSQHIPTSTPGTVIAKSGAGQCDYCHTTSYTSMTFTAYASANIHTQGTSIPSTLKCSSCHNGSYTGEGTTGAQAKTAVNHIPTAITDSSGLDCNACHSATSITISSTGFATGEVMNHNSDQGGSPNYCVNCHLKGLTYLSKAQLMSHNGASTSKDCSSSGCHKPLGSKGSAYTKWD
jgi:hypothetical protein